MHCTELEDRCDANRVSRTDLPRLPALGLLFVASFVTLYFELLVIRYLSSEIRIFAYLKNLPLIASFLGIGMGMILGRRTLRMRSAFPGLAAFLFGVIWACSQTGANYFGIPTYNYGVWNNVGPDGGIIGLAGYFAFVGGFLYLVVRFFVPLGGMIGEYMAREESALRAYAVNLVGSLAGIIAFTLLSFSGAHPWLWLLVGFAALLPMLPRNYLTVGLLTATVVLTSISFHRGRSYRDEFWSPYYYITLTPGTIPAGSSTPDLYHLRVNYDYHQTIWDLSNEFLARNPQLKANRSALAAYNVPFQLVPAPAEVLIVGAGTGNDVAAALRNGAGHVDAVEIDPTILSIGRRFHPEHPYDSSRVTVHVDDARAFFKQANRKYDLIVFSYLDSHTMFSSYSSLRLDNFVYTRESFEEARTLLKPDGALVLAFASGRTLITPRIFSTLRAAFGIPPRVYQKNDDASAVVFVEGNVQAAKIGPAFTDITPWAQGSESEIATDSWPFLYLPRHRIPWPIWSILGLFLCAAIAAVRRMLPVERSRIGSKAHFFLLGAGFLLLETRGVTELSLMFGSTWLVNSIVIGAFLCMALLSNLLVMKRSIPFSVAYAGLFLSALLSAVFPMAVLNSYSVEFRIVAAGLLTALPVFFSGIVFSRSLSQSANTNEALGVNLIGAIFGGALESTVMIGGTGILGPLAILLYLGSAVPLMLGKVGLSNAAAATATGAAAYEMPS